MLQKTLKDEWSFQADKGEGQCRQRECPQGLEGESGDWARGAVQDPGSLSGGAGFLRTGVGPSGDSKQPRSRLTPGCQASLDSSLWGKWREHGGETDVGAGSSSGLTRSPPTFCLSPPEEPRGWLLLLVPSLSIRPAQEERRVPFFCMKRSKESSLSSPSSSLPLPRPGPFWGQGWVVGGPRWLPRHLALPWPLTSLSGVLGGSAGPRFWEACGASSALQGLRETLPGGPVCTLRQGPQGGVDGIEILGPRSEAANFSCPLRGLQECWMEKCRTTEFLYSTHPCTDGKLRPERESDLPKACQPCHSWGGPGPGPPAPSSPELWTPHFGGSRVLDAHESLLAAHLGLAPARCPPTPTLGAGGTGVEPSAADTKHITI